jgi:signal transduction histidine kinase
MSFTSSYEEQVSANNLGLVQDAARLLVVDDDESVAITVSEVLRLDGHAVETAMSGAEAVARLKEQEYDLVLTDLHMEEVDGISVLAEVRRRAPLTISIVLTGFASLESAIAAMRQGAYDYLVKPCVIDDMKLTIRRGLDHRRLMLAEREARTQLEALNHELERRVEERTIELQRANEELASASRTKDIFFATLSHELRTPLTPILGWAKVLRIGGTNAELLDQGFSAIERNARLQARLIDDLLDMSRIISGKLHIEFEMTDICCVIEAAAETVRDEARTRGVDLQIDLPDAPLMVRGAPVRLQQIVWNLLSNSIKFTEKGGQVAVRARRLENDAKIEVSDTGIGIAPEFLPHIFEPFHQADGSTTRKYGGLGLGLAIVHKLIKLHGGQVHVESEGVGQGARFTFSVPCGATYHAPQTPVVALSPSGFPQSVLIVEDSADTSELLQTLFAQKGCRVLGAGSVGEALSIIEAEQPNLIISDIGLPDADGYELLERLRHLPKMEKVPVIAVSGYVTEEDCARALAAGFAAHIGKPIDIDDLISTVHTLTA